MPISNNILAGSGQGGADLGEPIEQSLRFTGDSRIVCNTQQPTGNFTVSFWFKQALGVTQTHCLLMFGPNQAYQYAEGQTNRICVRTSNFFPLSEPIRDHSAWYHVVIVNNSGTSSMYLNGVLQPGTAGTPSGSSAMVIGSNSNSSQDDRLVGYLAEYNLFDGTLLTADDFGRTNDDGVWVPKKIEGEFTAAQYGQKGFRFTFDSTQTPDSIGTDSAPIGATGHTTANNATAVNFNTTAGHIDYAIDFKDTPTNNIPTLNWISSGAGGNLEKGNLIWATSGPSVGVVSAGHSLSSGKWYWEVDISTQGSGFGAVGIRHIQHSNRRANDLGNFATDFSYQGDGLKINNGGGSAYGATYTTGDRIGVAFDADAGTLEFFKNNVSQGVAFTGIEGEYLPSIGDRNTGSVFQGDVDFGQKPFEFSPPAGYKEISTDNFAEPLIKDPRDHHQVFFNTGANILSDCQTAFPNGMYMIKGDNSGEVFYYIDPINGTNAAHRTPLPTATAAYSPNTQGNSYAWCWNCPDTFTASGITAGRRNVKAGFSIVKYTGDNSNPRSIPHGLGRKVGWVILWNPDANDTTCFITGLPGTGTNTENFIWNTAEASSNQFSAGTQHTPTDVNNFIVGNSAGGSGVTGVNQQGINYTAFCWAPVPGYSIMGTYPGDGDPDGRFIHCGFKPKTVIIKSQGADHWHIYDTTRDVNNPCDRVFFINDTGSETDAGGNADIDILSNGFKLRGANGAINGSNNYNYVAFAESPFGGENVAPATAR